MDRSHELYSEKIKKVVRNYKTNWETSPDLDLDETIFSGSKSYLIITK